MHSINVALSVLITGVTRATTLDEDLTSVLAPAGPCLLFERAPQLQRAENSTHQLVVEEYENRSVWE